MNIEDMSREGLIELIKQVMREEKIVNIVSNKKKNRFWSCSFTHEDIGVSNVSEIDIR